MIEQKSLIDCLIEKNLVDPKEVEKAKSIQKKSNLRLEQVLLKKGVLLEKDLLETYAEFFDLLYEKTLDTKDIEKLQKLVPLKFIQKYKIVPYWLSGRTLKLAITDPSQMHPLDELRLSLSDYDVIPVLATETEVLRIIHKHFDIVGEKNDSGAIGLEEGLEFLEELDDLQNSMDLAQEAPIIKMVNVILSTAINERASDIHIEPQEKELWVRFRVDGILRRVLNPPKSIQNGITSRIKIMANMNIAENRLPQDGRIKIRFGGKDIDIRVSTLPAQFGERVVMRLLNKTDTKFELNNIGFTKTILEKYAKLIRLPYGIILITGPTGSGKTSTLYASLNEINNEELNIITVEDPIEYQINGVNQVQARPKIGLNFAEGLRTILRQDPDIIMVGEIRDEETARVAIQSALTGHLVFSTLHTNDAPSAITRLLDMGIEPFLVASTCRGFMAQRLVRKLCPHCKKKSKISANEIKRLGYSTAHKSSSSLTIYEAKGCDLCLNTGYQGRIGIYELLIVDQELREQMLHNPSLDQLKESAAKQGMQTLRHAALEKVVDGITSLEEALRVT